MCINCIEQGTDNGGFCDSGQNLSFSFHQIIKGPCLICKKACGGTLDPCTVIPAGSKFGRNYICVNCVKEHLDPILDLLLGDITCPICNQPDSQHEVVFQCPNLAIAEKSHAEYLSGIG